VNASACFQRSGPGHVARRTTSGSQWALSSELPSLPALPTAPGHARAQVRNLLLAWGMSALADAAALVVTELTTNAVRASEQSGRKRDGQVSVVSVCLYGNGAALRIEVWDQATGFPLSSEAPVDSECGRGLTLIDAVTEGRWGWHPADHPWAVKCVWAEIRAPGPATASTQLTSISAPRPPNAENEGRNMTTSATKTDRPLPPRELITADLFSKLTIRVVVDEGLDRDTAEKIVEQALAFLVACARYPNEHLSPSETIDAGWHAFILHTADYAEFCDRVAGRFIHHRPNESGEGGPVQQAIGFTIAAMREAGLHVDTPLWVPRTSCSQCYRGCSDDPKGA
jgi:anti-sigma regulatory factor (Ser/Thr protein kinase)